MNTLRILLSQPWVQDLGWTLIQFLWQGTVLSVLFAAVRGWFGGWMTSNERYRMACCTLGAMAAAPVLTFIARPRLAAGPTPFIAWPLASAGDWEPFLPWLVAAWFGGVVLFSIRLIGGWRVTARLRSHGIRPAPAQWQQKLQELMERIEVSRPVQLLVSSMVEVPTVVGWLRPVVLVPVGALMGLPAGHMEALLAHELAHIRRLDYLMNVLQSVAETVLFYHPAVWWISGEIRAERELCCDDLAVAASGDVLTYVRALAELESFRPVHSEPALSANGGVLLHRIQRLMGQTPAASQALPGPGASCVMGLLWLAGLGVMLVNGAPATPVNAPPQPLVNVVAAPAAAEPAPKPPVLTALLFGPYGPDPQERPAAAPVVNTKIRVEGRVVSSTGGPVSNAEVKLAASASPGNPGYTATSDAAGQFTFEDVAPGRYVLQATRNGFLTSAYGSPSPGAAPPVYTLEAGQTIPDAIIRLTPQSVVAGRVTDQGGEPVTRASVELFRVTYIRGKKQSQRVARGATDDEGRFRVWNLVGGRYYIWVLPPRFINPNSATVAADTRPQDVPTYYPSAQEMTGAVGVTVTAGATVEGLDVRLRRERLYAVKGRIAYSGTQGRATQVAVVPKEHQTESRITGTGGLSFARPVADGVFEASDLPPGTYVLEALGCKGTMLCYDSYSGAPIADGRLEVTVGNADLAGVVVPVMERFEVLGTVRAEEGTYQDLGLIVPSVGIGLVPASGNDRHFPVPVNADGSFRALLGAAGNYTIDVSGVPEHLYVKSARFEAQDGRRAPVDISGTGKLEIVLSAKAASVSGVLRNDRGEPLPGVTVTIWPRSLTAASPAPAGRSVSTDQNGAFKLGGLAPGDYALAAWEGEGLNSGLIQAPGLLSFFSTGAVAVSLLEATQANVTPKVIPAGEITAVVEKLP